MIFKPELARLILTGRKTATRRPTKPNETECRYQTGKDYAVQAGRGKSSIARILITDVTPERLEDLTFQDARAEGFRTRADFAKYWLHLHTSRKPATIDNLTDDQALDLWLTHHGNTTVWAITFQLDTRTRPHTTRLLGKTGGYTNRPDHAISTRDDRGPEPEGVDDAWLIKYAKDAQAANDTRQAQHRHHQDTLPLHERLARLETTPPQGVDTTRELHIIRQKIRQLEAKHRRAA